MGMHFEKMELTRKTHMHEIQSIGNLSIVENKGNIKSLLTIRAVT